MRFDSFFSHSANRLNLFFSITHKCGWIEFTDFLCHSLRSFFFLSCKSIEFVIWKASWIYYISKNYHYISLCSHLSHLILITSVFILSSAAFAVIASSNHLSSRCQEYGIPSLCFHAFPLCDDSGDKPKPRRICKDECQILESDVCKTEYILAKRHKLIG